MSYRYFKNVYCQFYPCHEDFEYINCLFCYCPIYSFSDCGGNYRIMGNGWKDCSNCLLPHTLEGYDYVVNKIISHYDESLIN